MKKILFTLVIGLIPFCLFSQSNAVMVKSVETYGTFMSIKKMLYIVDESGNTQTIELEKHNAKGIPENMVIVKKTLDKYLNDGYELISSNAISFGENAVYTVEHTYLFRKRE